MKIKFLSVIVSFLFVSLATTSCLDNNNYDIEYSPDAIIKQFAIDTIHGITYNFTINQFGPDGIGEIYNQDSLPYGSDSIIDRILITELTTASGIVTSYNPVTKQDTLFNIADSMDLRNPFTVKVWSLEAYANAENGPIKQYNIKVNVHKQDPDSMQWAKMPSLSGTPGVQKSVVLTKDNQEYIYVYAANVAYKGEITDKGATINWQTIKSDLIALPNSLISRNDTLFTTANHKLYYSKDGSTWEESSLLNSAGDIVTLTAALKDSISAVITYPDGEMYFSKVGNIKDRWVKGDAVPTGDDDVPFPLDGISSTTYINATGVEQSILMGNQTKNTKYTVPWMTTRDDRGWGDLANSITAASCPYLSNPSIIHYNDAFYAFGGDFSTIYKSLGGLAWYQADSKFWIPAEFKDKGNYSLVVGKDNHIWIMWSNGEVWRGRLNKLGFKPMIR